MTFHSPVAPQKPKLEHDGQHVLPGNNVTVDSGATATVKCVSHYGNPPAILKWFLGDQEIMPLHPQTNSTEPDNPKTWSAASVVQIPATKKRHGMPLKCLSFHEYYSARTVGVEARMDVRCEFQNLINISDSFYLVHQFSFLDILFEFSYFLYEI
jgi:CD80-like C2-set immunoglobulin domain